MKNIHASPSFQKETISLIITNILLIFLIGASVYFIVTDYSHPAKKQSIHADIKGGDH